MSRTRALAVRVLRITLFASGVAFWLALLAAYAFDASPLDSFDLHVGLTWARGGAAPPAENLRRWPDRP